MIRYRAHIYASRVYTSSTGTVIVVRETTTATLGSACLGCLPSKPLVIPRRVLPGGPHPSLARLRRPPAGLRVTDRRPARRCLWRPM